MYLKEKNMWQGPNPQGNLSLIVRVKMQVLKKHINSLN